MTTHDKPTRLALVDAGLGEGSLTSVLCERALGVAPEGVEVSLFSARDHHVLPYGEEGVAGTDELTGTLAAAEAVILVFPVYNFNMNATLKAVIEHGGPAMAGKVVGLMATAGGRFGYMSFLSVIQGLLFDLRCWVVPRQVYALVESFTDGKLTDDEVSRRVDELVHATVDAARRLSD